MKNTPPLVLIFCLAFPFFGFAQTANLSQLVSFHYHEVRLGDALSDISLSYDVKFSYSRYYIPVDQPVSADVNDQPLATALGNLFNETGIVYKQIGDQLVLRVEAPGKHSLSLKTKEINVRPVAPINQNPREQFPRIIKETTPVPGNRKSSIQKESENGEDIIFQAPVFEEKASEAEAVIVEDRSLHPVNALPVLPIPELVAPTEELRAPVIKNAASDENDFYFSKQRAPKNSLAQISIIPNLSTNIEGAEEIANSASINIFYGKNGGVNGFELGGGVNVIKYDVIGGQIAGIGNKVGGDVDGAQLSGIFNRTRGEVIGAQFAGIINTCESGDAIQAAGWVNVVKKEYKGFQAAGLVNTVGGAANAYQIAGLANFSGGNTKFQASGLVNFAGDVELGQVSAVFNKAGHVASFQLGLINVSDSISGVPIGLINIVKSGKNSYNRLEISGAELLYLNTSLRFGAKTFYNIIHVGYRPEQNVDSWGLGYGIGKAFTTGERSIINTELVAIHVNEAANWTQKLNLLNQFRLSYDYRLGRKFSFFAGPTVNVLVSELFDTETNKYGTSLAPYTIFDNQSKNTEANPTNVKIWAGLNAGVRF